MREAMGGSMCNLKARRSDKEPCEACIPARELAISTVYTAVEQAGCGLYQIQPDGPNVPGQSPSNDAVWEFGGLLFLFILDPERDEPIIM